jgi:hypothetical protein
LGNGNAAVDEVRCRLRDAIAAGELDEEEQLRGVLRMLGEKIAEQDQLLLFGETLRTKGSLRA